MRDGLGLAKPAFRCLLFSFIAPSASTLSSLLSPPVPPLLCSLPLVVPLTPRPNACSRSSQTPAWCARKEILVTIVHARYKKE